MEERTGGAPNYVRRALDLFGGYGDVEALVAVDGRRYTFTDLRERIRSTAAALHNHGIRPGMTVAFLVSNTAASLFTQLGAHLLGARIAPMQPILPRPVLREHLGFVDAQAFVYDANELAELGRELAQGSAPMLTLCLGAGGLGPDLSDVPVVDELPFDPLAVTVPPRALFQTSGTTGTPKLLCHGERFYRTIPKVSDYYRPTTPGVGVPNDAEPPRIRHLSISGTWHAGGQSAALMTWFSGGLYYMLPDFDLATYLDTIGRERITSLHLSPPDIYLLLDSPLLPSADLSSLRMVTVCCAAASPARLSQAAKWFGPALNVVYGMSEIPMITVLRNAGDPAHPHRLASAGLPWEDNRISIRDAGGADLPAGEIGDIWVTGEYLTEGYWNAPEVNAANFVGGWLRTGDVGRLDDEGYLYIVDRATDTILTDMGSIVVYCRPLEDALAEHPQVRQAAVVGVPDELMGEAIHAYVVRAAGATVTEEELRLYVAEQLSKYWSPREVEFIDALPTNQYGKVDKLALRAMFVARSQQPAAGLPT